MTGMLMDGFAEAQLDGWFTVFLGGDLQLDVDAGTITPDTTNAQNALIVLYAAYRMILARLANLKNKVHYAASGATYETEQSASILTTLLAELAARKLQLYTRALYSGANAAFHMADGYYLAATQTYYLPYTVEPYALTTPNGF